MYIFGILYIKVYDNGKYFYGAASRKRAMKDFERKRKIQILPRAPNL